LPEITAPFFQAFSEIWRSGVCAALRTNSMRTRGLLSKAEAHWAGDAERRRLGWLSIVSHRTGWTPKDEGTYLANFELILPGAGRAARRGGRGEKDRLSAECRAKIVRPGG
jgi:hypothetical protein